MSEVKVANNGKDAIEVDIVARDEKQDKDTVVGTLELPGRSVRAFEVSAGQYLIVHAPGDVMRVDKEPKPDDSAKKEQAAFKQAKDETVVADEVDYDAETIDARFRTK